MSVPPLTIEQQQYITDNYLIATGRDIAAALGILPDRVWNHQKRNGLVVPRDIQIKLRIAKMPVRNTFSKAEDDFICANYLEMSVKKMADSLGRSDSGIQHRLTKLGLEIPAELVARNKAIGRVKPGEASFNKGKKMEEYMSPESIERTVATRFKKGTVPPNTYEADGVITIRCAHPERGEKPYHWIRVSIGEWKELHRYNWEKVNGPIPKGHCLWCLTEDTLNCDTANWELITRADNVRRNSGSLRLNDKAVATYMASKNKSVDKELKAALLQHPEVLELQRQQYLLKRAIKASQA